MNHFLVTESVFDSLAQPTSTFLLASKLGFKICILNGDLCLMEAMRNKENTLKWNGIEASKCSRDKRTVLLGMPGAREGKRDREREGEGVKRKLGNLAKLVEWMNLRVGDGE